MSADALAVEVVARCLAGVVASGKNRVIDPSKWNKLLDTLGAAVATKTRDQSDADRAYAAEVLERLRDFKLPGSQFPTRPPMRPKV